MPTRQDYQNHPFVIQFRGVQSQVFSVAVEHGWWEEDRNDGELIALMHSELSEALEYLRHDNKMSDHIPEFFGVEEELADTIIRIMDMAQMRGWDVASALMAKLEYNAGRPYKHGGKKF